MLNSKPNFELELKVLRQRSSHQIDGLVVEIYGDFFFLFSLIWESQISKDLKVLKKITGAQTKPWIFCFK